MPWLNDCWSAEVISGDELKGLLGARLAEPADCEFKSLTAIVSRLVV